MLADLKLTSVTSAADISVVRYICAALALRGAQLVCASKLVSSHVDVFITEPDSSYVVADQMNSCAAHAFLCRWMPVHSHIRKQL